MRQERVHDRDVRRVRRGRPGHLQDLRAALYVALFLTTLLAVLLRDDAEPLLRSIPWAARVGFDPSPAWFGAQAVHRVSLGAFFFFASLSALTAGVADRSDVRDRVVHHGSWTLKFAAWALCMFLPFLLPPRRPRVRLAQARRRRVARRADGDPP